MTFYYWMHSSTFINNWEHHYTRWNWEFWSGSVLFRFLPLPRGILVKSRTEQNKADFLTFFHSSTVPPFRMLLDQFICIFFSELTARLIVSSLTFLFQIGTIAIKVGKWTPPAEPCRKGWWSENHRHNWLTDWWANMLIDWFTDWVRLIYTV